MNLLGAVTNGLPVSRAISAATLALKPSGAFSPVPTAVPPTANSSNPPRLCLISAMQARSWAA